MAGIEATAGKSPNDSYEQMQADNCKHRGPLRERARRENNRRWAIEMAVRCVQAPEVISTAREMVAFVEEAPDA